LVADLHVVGSPRDDRCVHAAAGLALAVVTPARVRASLVVVRAHESRESITNYSPTRLHGTYGLQGTAEATRPCCRTRPGRQQLPPPQGQPLPRRGNRSARG